MKTQYDRLAVLLTRPGGCTMLEVSRVCNSTTPSRRVSDMRDRGWIITKHKVEGKNYHRFFGNPPPAKKTKYVPKTVWVK